MLYPVSNRSGNIREYLHRNTLGIASPSFITPWWNPVGCGCIFRMAAFNSTAALLLVIRSYVVA